MIKFVGRSGRALCITIDYVEAGYVREKWWIEASCDERVDTKRKLYGYKGRKSH